MCTLSCIAGSLQSWLQGWRPKTWWALFPTRPTVPFWFLLPTTLPRETVEHEAGSAEGTFLWVIQGRRTQAGAVSELAVERRDGNAQGVNKTHSSAETRSHTHILTFLFNVQAFQGNHSPNYAKQDVIWRVGRGPAVNSGGHNNEVRNGKNPVRWWLILLP